MGYLFEVFGSHRWPAAAEDLEFRRSDYNAAAASRSLFQTVEWSARDR
jgi:hypothetical protein